MQSHCAGREAASAYMSLDKEDSLSDPMCLSLYGLPVTSPHVTRSSRFVFACLKLSHTRGSGGSTEGNEAVHIFLFKLTTPNSTCIWGFMLGGGGGGGGICPLSPFGKVTGWSTLSTLMYLVTS